MYILSLLPELHEKPWGGRRLMDEYGYKYDKKNAGEAWLLSCHKDGKSIVQNGAYRGRSLREVFETEDRSVWGTHFAPEKDFPILIKLIDAEDKLSIQVHPDDEYARINDNDSGKTESWYIVDAKPGAELIYGFDHEVTREEFLQSIEDESVTQLLQHVPVRPGDLVYIPSGTVHAIGAGILLAEVQQSSNATYRIFDYGRPGDDGEPRPLHKKKAADVLNYDLIRPMILPPPIVENVAGGVRTPLIFCPFFHTELLKVRGTMTDIVDETSFVSLLAIEGEGELSAKSGTLSVKKGASIVIPAGEGEYTLSGSLTILRTAI